MDAKVELKIKVKGKSILVRMRKTDRISRIVELLQQKDIIKASDGNLRIINLENQGLLRLQDTVGSLAVCQKSQCRQVSVYTVGQFDKRQYFSFENAQQDDVGFENICQYLSDKNESKTIKLAKKGCVLYRFLQQMQAIKKAKKGDGGLLDQKLLSIKQNYANELKDKQMKIMNSKTLGLLNLDEGQGSPGDSLLKHIQSYAKKSITNTHSQFYTNAPSSEIIKIIADKPNFVMLMSFGFTVFGIYSPEPIKNTKSEVGFFFTISNQQVHVIKLKQKQPLWRKKLTDINIGDDNVLKIDKSLKVTREKQLSKSFNCEQLNNQKIFGTGSKNFTLQNFQLMTVSFADQNCLTKSAVSSKSNKKMEEG